MQYILCFDRIPKEYNLLHAQQSCIQFFLDIIYRRPRPNQKNRVTLALSAKIQLSLWRSRLQARGAHCRTGCFLFFCICISLNEIATNRISLIMQLCLFGQRISIYLYRRESGWNAFH